MSRLGKRPVVLPAGVSAAVRHDDRVVEIKGPKGTLKWVYPAGVKVSQAGDGSNQAISVVPEAKIETLEGPQRALWGLTRSKIAGMVAGVAQGFTKTLEIQGVGYKARLEGHKLVLSLGNSHPINFEIPSGATITVDPKQTLLTIAGSDKELVGRVAGVLRALKPPEPYKGKGIRYAGEHIIRKAGKAAATAGTGAKK
ncbi:MAG: 50S ribosomal protein L6 [Elusimicrobia bacterium]|nr:50S ribosomal protein L6 [Elusimicrobiota bacterium]